MRRKLFGSITVLLLIVAAAQPAAAAIQEVRDGAVREYGFAIDRNAGGDVVRAWAQDSRLHPYRFQVYWQAGGDPPVRKTPLSTTADVGGVAFGTTLGDLLSYDVYNRQTGDYGVKFYDFVGDHTVAVPPGVNTNAQESHPTVSGNYLLFQRWNRQGTSRVILVNLTTGTPTELASTTNGLVLADQVNGDYAVYTFCPANFHCKIHRYQISTTTTDILPNAGRSAYSSTVTPAGDVFYAIGHPSRCGVNTQLHHWTSGNVAPKIQQLSNSVEVASTWAYEPLSGGDNVYFTRLICQPRGAFRSGIYLRRIP